MVSDYAKIILIADMMLDTAEILYYQLFSVQESSFVESPEPAERYQRSFSVLAESKGFFVIDVDHKIVRAILIRGNAGLSSPIRFHGAMPVQMIGREIEYGRHFRPEILRSFELERTYLCDQPIIFCRVFRFSYYRISDITDYCGTDSGSLEYLTH